MSSIHRRHENHVPDNPVELPPIYVWPMKLKRIVVWFFTEFLYPWGLFFMGLSVVSWWFLTPDMVRMADFSLDWIVMIWLRNFLLLCSLAGILHWYLHIKRAQGKRYKYDKRWLAKNSKRFLFKDQTKDNMFWSLVSGVTFWTFYESATLWAYASGVVATVSWSDSPRYLVFLIIVTFFWSALHFEFAHRPLHWRPIYRYAHALHHRNVNTGPWSGISMHPLEHSIYFSVFLLWWVVPAHPFIVILTGFFQGLSPAVSHCGFEKIEVGRLRLPAGTHFHTLHHQLFEVNYAHILTPTDALVGTFHDGTDEAYQRFAGRT
ncbi:MAG: sterol desaturase family protein [Pseudomonadota bacterium]